MSDYCSDVFKELVTDRINNNIPEKSRVVVFLIFSQILPKSPFTFIPENTILGNIQVISNPSLLFKDFFERKKPTPSFFTTNYANGANDLSKIVYVPFWIVDSV